MDEPFGKRGVFERREIHELDPFKIGELGEALHQIERFLGELFIDHFDGEAPSKEDIVEANRMSQSEFEKMMKEYIRKHGRIVFA